ncbi:DMT family transporter [Phyllobacterium sp. UNC302MFCol5.2]|uniref:DMT family transporter n=1 Tax=Phyllobacterium sp. UNC302MFCol5.2 TaxID=1449065 RepID=UPI000481DC48|nr:DMT family transporter [Phyllobacterium sp. UNC302MFCol5.2]
MNRVAEYRLGLILVTASAVAWSLAGLFTRAIPLDSWTILAWRGIFGSIGIAVAMMLFEGGIAWKSFRHMGRPGWLFVAVSSLGMVFFITALKETTVAHVAVIYATIPFVAAVVAWLAMGERSTLRAIVASIAAMGGVIIMVGLGTEGSLFGDLLAFGMTLCMGVLMVIVRRSPEISVMPAACVSALLSSLICWPLGNPLSVSAHDLLLIAMFGILVSAVGLACFTLGAKWLPPIETALIGSLDAPLAPFWIWLVFNEAPSKSTVIGGSIVFAAVVANVLAGTKKGPTPANSVT